MQYLLFPCFSFLLFLYTYIHTENIVPHVFKLYKMELYYTCTLATPFVLFVLLARFIYPVATCCQSFLSPTVVDAVAQLVCNLFVCNLSALLLIDIWVVFQFLAITNNVAMDTFSIAPVTVSKSVFRVRTGSGAAESGSVPLGLLSIGLVKWLSKVTSPIHSPPAVHKSPRCTIFLLHVTVRLTNFSKLTGVKWNSLQF